MNLYFMDSEGVEHLVAESVEKNDAVNKALEDLAARNPKFVSHYQRTWWDDNYRFWIDVGSWSEFYILHVDYEDMKHAEEDCEMCKI